MAYNRHAAAAAAAAAAKQDDEEYRGLIRSNGNDAPSTATNCLRLMNRARAIKMRLLSTPTLIFSVFIMGALFGSLLSSSSKRSSENNNIITTILPSSLKEDDEIMKARDVHVSSMCRCPSGLVPVPLKNQQLNTIYQTVPKNNPTNHVGQVMYSRVIQPPSKATGSFHKRYIHYPLQNCECRKGNGRLEITPTKDKFLSKISRSYFEQTCSLNHPETESQTNWDQMPDFGVEDLPIFAGILSYESPLSLQSSIHNWLDNDLFHRIAAQDVFVQLNHRSERDDEILREFLFSDAFQRDKLNKRHPLTITGSAEENLNPGMAISKFCRMAEQHPSSHPNGENLLLFLEKDWVITDNTQKKIPNRLESIFRSAIALSQRGVPYISLRAALSESDGYKAWNCPAEGVPWTCTTAHQHRWTNLPALIDCRWFLRYLEPFALMSLTDPIMSCGRTDGYCDWEKAMQDGRIAWTNSQWVIAHITRDGGQLFYHKEVDK